MDPITLGALITGGAGLIGSIFSSDTSAQNTQMQMANQQQLQSGAQAFNAQQAAVQRDWSATQAQIGRDYQTQMSNTAYQRSRADMMAAGLNPILAANAGGATSAGGPMPSGSAASVSTPSAPMPQNRSALADLGENVSRAVNSAVSMKHMDKMTDEIASLRVQRDKLIAETATEKERKEYVAATAGTERNRAENIAQQTTALKLDRARQEWEAIKYLDLSNIPDVARKAGNIGSWGAEKLSDTVQPFISSALGIRRLIPEKKPIGSTFTERFDAHKGGYTKSRETWDQY